MSKVKMGGIHRDKFYYGTPEYAEGYDRIFGKKVKNGNRRNKVSTNPSVARRMVQDGANEEMEGDGGKHNDRRKQRVGRRRRTSVRGR